jgi:hypothetical protein
MTAEKIKIQPKFTEEEVNNVLKKLEVESNPALIESLRYGQRSPLIRDIKTEGGALKDGKIDLHKTKEGGVIVNYNFKNLEKFEVPKKILGQKLSKEQQEDLVASKPIKLKSKGKEYYVQIDPELNKVTLKTPDQVITPNKLGGYKLTEEDKLQIIDKGSLDTKVFYNKDTDKHYTANLSIDQKENTISLENMKEIPSSEVEKKIAQHNNAPETKVINELEPKVIERKDLSKFSLINEVVENHPDLGKDVLLVNKETKEGIILKADKQDETKLKFESVNNPTTGETLTTSDINKNINNSLSPSDVVKSMFDETTKTVEVKKDASLNKDSLDLNPAHSDKERERIINIEPTKASNESKTIEVKQSIDKAAINDAANKASLDIKVPVSEKGNVKELAIQNIESSLQNKDYRELQKVANNPETAKSTFDVVKNTEVYKKMDFKEQVAVASILKQDVKQIIEKSKDKAPSEKQKVLKVKAKENALKKANNMTRTPKAKNLSPIK